MNKPASTKQKFQRHDLVHIDKEMPSWMSHFTSDKDAIVLYSNRERGGGSSENDPEYALYIEGKGFSAWYNECQLTLIVTQQKKLKKKWKAKAEKEQQEKSDLDWIFANGDAVLKKGFSASVSSLAKCFGLSSLWGASGEGLTHYLNTLQTLALAEPYLVAKDKEGWLKYSKTLKLK